MSTNRWNHIGLCPRQFGAVIVGVGDDIRSGVGASRAGHGCAPPDGVVHVSVGGDRAVLDLRDKVAVRLVGPGGCDAVGTDHLRHEAAVCKTCVVEAARGDGDPVHAAVCVVAVRAV